MLDAAAAKNKHDTNHKEFTKWERLRDKTEACWDLQTNTGW